MRSFLFLTLINSQPLLKCVHQKRTVVSDSEKASRSLREGLGASAAAWRSPGPAPFQGATWTAVHTGLPDGEVWALAGPSPSLLLWGGRRTEQTGLGRHLCFWLRRRLIACGRRRVDQDSSRNTKDPGENPKCVFLPKVEVFIPSKLHSVQDRNASVKALDC